MNLPPVLLILLIFPCRLYSQISISKKVDPRNKVGAILFDPEVDDPSFTVCDEGNILEHYEANPIFGEGLKSIRRYFSQYRLDLIAKDLEDGLLSIRFIVNCDGFTNRYRVSAINLNYQTQSVPKENEIKLKTWVKNMGQWRAGQYQGLNYDAYKFINFKIRDEQVVEIFY